jgi:hypothetical protein
VSGGCSTDGSAGSDVSEPGLEQVYRPPECVAKLVLVFVVLDGALEEVSDDDDDDQ